MRLSMQKMQSVGRRLAVLLFAGTLACNGTDTRTDGDQDSDFVLGGPGDGDPAQMVLCSTVPRPPVTVGISNESGNVVRFAPGSGARNHRLYVARRFSPPGNPRSVTIREMGGDTVGVEITSNQNLPNQPWAVLVLDYRGCDVPAERVVVAKRGNNQLQTRTSVVDPQAQEVTAIIYGASSYILASN